MSRLSEAWEAWLDSSGDDDGETNDELAEAIAEAAELDDDAE